MHSQAVLCFVKFHCQTQFWLRRMNRQNLKILDVYLSVATNSVYFIKFKNNHDMVAVNMEFVFDCSLPQVI